MMITKDLHMKKKNTTQNVILLVDIEMGIEKKQFADCT